MTVVAFGLPTGLSDSWGMAMSPGPTDVLGWKSCLAARYPDLPFHARGEDSSEKELISLMWELGQQEQPCSIYSLG